MPQPEETVEFWRRVYRNITGWNDCHPCGGSELSRRLEDDLRAFLEKEIES